MKLLVVEKLEKDVLDWLGARHTLRFAPELAADPRGMRLALLDVQGVVLPAGMTVDNAWLLQAPKLHAVGRLIEEPSVSEAAACEHAGVQWIRSSLSGARAEAEFMLGALLSLLRRVPMSSVGGKWLGRELSSCHIGFLGLSRASKPLAQWLSSMGTAVLGHDPALPSEAPVWSRWGIQAVSVQELLQQSDGLCIQLTNDKVGFLSEALLGFCKRKQVWVSTAGLQVMDQVSVARALEGGMLSAAWIDHASAVAPGEAAAEGLSALPQVQLTSQLAANSYESHLRAGWEVARRMDQSLWESQGLPVPPANEASLMATAKTHQLVA